MRKTKVILETDGYSLRLPESTHEEIYYIEGEVKGDKVVFKKPSPEIAYGLLNDLGLILDDKDLDMPFSIDSIKVEMEDENFYPEKEVIDITDESMYSNARGLAEVSLDLLKKLDYKTIGKAIYKYDYKTSIDKSNLYSKLATNRVTYAIFIYSSGMDNETKQLKKEIETEIEREIANNPRKMKKLITEFSKQYYNNVLKPMFKTCKSYEDDIIDYKMCLKNEYDKLVNTYSVAVEYNTSDVEMFVPPDEAIYKIYNKEICSTLSKHLPEVLENGNKEVIKYYGEFMQKWCGD